MGLADLTPSKGKKGSGSSSGGSSSSGRWTLTGVSPSDFPVYKKEKPYLIILEQDGEWGFLQYPETPTVELRFDWYSDSEFENEGYFRETEGWRRWFWSREEYLRIKRRVQAQLDLDLMEILRERPHKALEVIKMAANPDYAAKLEPTERCPVCSERIHVIYDEYEVVNNRRVHLDHNVRDLAEADLL